MAVVVPVPTTQEEIIHVPTFTQQESIRQQQVELVFEVPTPMTQEEIVHVPNIINQHRHHHGEVEQIVDVHVPIEHVMGSESGSNDPSVSNSVKPFKTLRNVMLGGKAGNETDIVSRGSDPRSSSTVEPLKKLVSKVLGGKVENETVNGSRGSDPRGGDSGKPPTKPANQVVQGFSETRSSLVNRVKELQRSDPCAKEQWVAFAHESDPAKQRTLDPSRYPADLLTVFLTSSPGQVASDLASDRAEPD
eukprot:11666734-Heterocapsa_arctica.AAC.1